MKPKKGLSGKKVVLILVSVIVLVWLGYSSYVSSNVPVTSSTSASTGLQESDYLITSESQSCVSSGQTEKLPLRLQFKIENRMGTPFHFVSARIVLLNFSLSNGTVVQVNQAVTDNKATFDTQHAIIVDFNMPTLPPNITVTNAAFTIGAYVQEVPAPVIFQLSEPIKPCSH